MGNYTIPDAENKSFWIHFCVLGNGTEWIDAGIPAPHWFYRLDGDPSFYYIAWLIDGFFATKRGQRYLHDVIARLVLLLPVRERLLWPPKGDPRPDIPPYHLKEISSWIPSLPRKWSGKTDTTDNNGKDKVFWAIKWKIEQIIESQGEGKPVVYELVYNWATDHFLGEVKDKSTLRAKARSVWNWYDKRNWTIPKRRESAMSREEHIKQVHNKRREESKRKVLGLLTGMFAEEYKRGNRWNVSKIAKDLRMGRDTVARIIKEWESTD